MSVNREEVCIHYSSERIQAYPTNLILVHKDGSHQTYIKSSQVATSSELTIACTYHTTIKLPVIKACDPHLYRPPHSLCFYVPGHVLIMKFSLDRRKRMVDGGVQTCIQTFLPVVVVCYMFKLLEFNKNSFFCSGILTIFLLISRVFFFF